MEQRFIDAVRRGDMEEANAAFKRWNDQTVTITRIGRGTVTQIENGYLTVSWDGHSIPEYFKLRELNQVDRDLVIVGSRLTFVAGEKRSLFPYPVPFFRMELMDDGPRRCRGESSDPKL